MPAKLHFWALLLLLDGLVIHARPPPSLHRQSPWWMTTRRMEGQSPRTTKRAILFKETNESMNSNLQHLSPRTTINVSTCRGGDDDRFCLVETPPPESNGEDPRSPLTTIIREGRFHATLPTTIEKANAKDDVASAMHPVDEIVGSTKTRRKRWKSFFKSSNKRHFSWINDLKPQKSFLVSSQGKKNSLLWLTVLSKWAIGLGAVAWGIHFLVPKWFPLRDVSLECWERMGRDQLPKFWNSEIVAAVDSSAATVNLSSSLDGESTSSQEEEPLSSASIPVTQNRPDLQRRLREQLRPLMMKRVHLVRKVERIIIGNKKSNTNNASPANEWSEEECKVIAMYYAERTVETLAPVTQALRERLQRGNHTRIRDDDHAPRRDVDRFLLVQGLKDRIYRLLLSSIISTTADTTDTAKTNKQRDEERRRIKHEQLLRRRASLLIKLLDEPTLRDMYKESIREAIVVEAV